ncbi:hypothetical protein CBW18_04530 [Pedobacter sp. AJM]|nr:hypothetical protein CBW18_04530 [Pedobacter sp. AJM]
MVSNTIKLSLGSILFFLFVACINENKINIKAQKKNSLPDSCRYYAYDARQIISNLSCYNCHIRRGERLNNILSFDELATMDSSKLVNFVFIKRHNGNYSMKGAFKTNRMDTLSDCEIKNAIHYIKDYGRDIPMP